jgi:hypothetical protein
LPARISTGENDAPCQGTQNNGVDRRSVRTVKRRIAASKKAAEARKAKKAAEAERVAEAAQAPACEAGQASEDTTTKGPWATTRVSDEVEDEQQQRRHQPAALRLHGYRFFFAVAWFCRFFFGVLGVALLLVVLFRNFIGVYSGLDGQALAGLLMVLGLLLVVFLVRLLGVAFLFMVWLGLFALVFMEDPGLFLLKIMFWGAPP